MPFSLSSAGQNQFTFVTFRSRLSKAHCCYFVKTVDQGWAAPLEFGMSHGAMVARNVSPDGRTHTMKGSQNNTVPRKLDSIDWKILTVLQENARIANVELADEVHLSPSPCLARVRTLERDGFINRYVTLLDSHAVGLGVNVFVQVRLEKQVESSFNVFEKAIATRPEIMECYLMTGAADYLLRVVVPDLESFQKLLTEFVAKIPGVGNTQSSIALKQVRYKTALPIPEE
jgi:Lrp/AsnC family leucine-responsive transcriptional regulator